MSDITPRPDDLVKVVETCCSCPNQWDAWDWLGRYYYFRNRFSRASVERGPDMESFWGHKRNMELVGELHHDDEFGPEMNLGEMLEMAGLRLAEGADVHGCVMCSAPYGTRDWPFED